MDIHTFIESLYRDVDPASEPIDWNMLDLARKEMYKYRSAILTDPKPATQRQLAIRRMLEAKAE